MMMHEPTADLDTEEWDSLQKCLKGLSHRPTILVCSPDPRVRNLADKTLTIESTEFSELEKWELDSGDEASVQMKLKGAA